MGFDWDKQKLAIRCIDDAFKKIQHAAIVELNLGETLRKAELGARRQERGHRAVFGPDMQARRQWRATVAQCARQLVVQWVARFDPKAPPASASDWAGAPPGLFEATQLAEQLHAAGKCPDLEHTKRVHYSDLVGPA